MLFSGFSSPLSQHLSAAAMTYHHHYHLHHHHHGDSVVSRSQCTVMAAMNSTPVQTCGQSCSVFLYLTGCRSDQLASV